MQAGMERIFQLMKIVEWIKKYSTVEETINSYA